MLEHTRRSLDCTAVLAVVILCSSFLLADDHRVDFDEHTDFTKIRTFAFHEAKIDSQRPELNNSLFARRLGDAIRDVLKTKGLTETSSSPDLLVDYTVAGQDYSIVERHPDTRIPDFPGQRGTVIRGTGPESVRFSEGTLIIDMTLRETGALVWRGVYRDTESNGSKLAQKLPVHAKSVVAEYPPKTKK